MQSVKTDNIPGILKGFDNWLHWDGESKQPKWKGTPIKDWKNKSRPFGETIAAAQENGNEYGIGFALNNDSPIFVIDIDRPFDEKGNLKSWVPDLDRFEDWYMEWSPSGNGIHIPIFGEPPEWWKNSDIGEHEGVDVLDNTFCTFTGDLLDESESDESEKEITHQDVSDWLFRAYQNIRGESPRLESKEETDIEFELSESEITEAISYLDPDLNYDEWVKTLYAIHNWDSGSKGEQIAKDWSRGGTKWDNEAESNIERIWNTASPTGGITVGTLIYKAKKRGYKPPSPDNPKIDEENPSWGDIKRLVKGKNKNFSLAYSLAADLLIEENRFVTVRRSGEFYRYDPELGHYQYGAETFIRETLREHVSGFIDSAKWDKIINEVIASNYLEAGEFKPPENKTLFKNGVLNVETGELENQSPDYYFKSRIEANWDPEADYQAFSSWLEEMQPEPENRKKLQEFAGYIFFEPWTHHRHKNLIQVGPTRTGKSTFNLIIMELLGGKTDNPAVTALSPQAFSDKDFAAAEMVDALANIRNDINSEPIKDSGTFKAFLSGEPTRLVRKYKDGYTGTTECKHLFSANWVPSIYNQSSGIWERIMIVEWWNHIPKEKRIHAFEEQLVEECGDGIIQWAWEGYQRLREQGGFTGDRDVSETRKLYNYWRDPVLLFIYQNCEVTANQEDWIDRGSFFRAYREWCFKHDHQPKTKTRVSRLIQESIGEVLLEDVKADIVGDGTTADVRAYIGMSIPRERQITGDLIAHIKDSTECAPGDSLDPERLSEVFEVDREKIESELNKLAEKHGFIDRRENEFLRL